MKRHNNLFSQIVDIDNLRLAHKRAQKGKQHYSAVKKINTDPDSYLLQIQEMLIKGTFSTSEYKVDKRFDNGKWRIIHKLPYFPDRIVQHAVMNICGPIWKSRFIRDTFQSIEGRGTHDARRRIEKFLSINTNMHAIKIDIKQFYPSVKNTIMKNFIKATIKCKNTLKILFNIIDSHIGLPIGNYTSQYLGNLYLTAFDWWIKQVVKLKGYFRYCDDIIFIHENSKYLYNIYLNSVKKLRELGLIVKKKVHYRYIPKQGLDFCGFIFFGTHTKLRKRIVDKLKEKAKQKNAEALLKSLMSYWGWVKYIDAKGLWRSIITIKLLIYTDNVYKENPLRGTI